MTPDVWLILLSTLLTVAGYLLYVWERLPRVRAVLGILAFVALVLSVVFHGVIASRQAPSADADQGARTYQSQAAGHDVGTS